MPDEDPEGDEDQPVQEEPQEDWKAKFEALEAQNQESQSEVKRLVTENKKYRERAQNAEFSGLKARYPQLEPEDIAGLNPEQVEKLLSKVAAKPDTGEEPDAPDPEAEAAKGFVEGAGGGAPAPGKTYTASEIQDIGLKDRARALQLIAEGRMQSP